MTKGESPSGKQDTPGSGYVDPLTKAMQEAKETIKQEQEEFADLTPADREANARTQQFVESLNREERSKFYSMISNKKFFNMFGAYARKPSPTNQEVGNEDQSPLASDDLADNEEHSTDSEDIRYRGATDTNRHGSTKS